MEFIESVKKVMDSLESPDQAASKSLAIKTGVVQGLCTFPVVAQWVMKILGDPDFRMSEVSKVINKDPALAAKVMRLANSAFFSRGKPVDSIDKAVVRLGRSTVNEAVCAVATMNMFPDVDGVGKTIRDHCASTAAICQELVKDLIPSQRDGAFLCGLMHDVGKLLLIASEEMLYANADPLVMAAPDQAIAVERNELGYDHAVLAGQVLWHWKFPDPIPQVVAWHHEPGIAYQDTESGYLVAMVRLASQIDRQLAFTLADQEEYIEQLANGKDCQFATVSEDYLIEKWPKFKEVRDDSLALFG